MAFHRGPNQPKTDIELARSFAKEKGLPVPGRFLGSSRRAYYAHSERVRVIRGLDLPFQAVGRLGAEAERRGVTNVELAEELGLLQQPEPSLPARIGHKVAEFLHIQPSDG